PCSPDVSETFWVVEDSAGASALADATNCSGGVFDVEWRGYVEFPSTLFITDGSLLNKTGATAEDRAAVANGGSSHQFINVVDSTVHVSSLRFEDCSATLGGCVFAHGSTVDFGDTSFSGNTADYDGGALVVNGSNVSWQGETSFFGNSAGYDGGALAAWDSIVFWNNTAGLFGGALYLVKSYLSWSTETTFTHNAAVIIGGAMVASDSTVSWSGKTSFSDNTADDDEGALFVSESDLSWSGETIFSGNTANSADSSGGALYGLKSNVSWSAETSFLSNSANSSGGALYTHQSNVSWSAETSFLSNSANSSGGALYTYQSNVSWSAETSFSDNSANGIIGGAMHVSESNVSWAGETIFSGNAADNSGGALGASWSYVFWSGETIFSGNAADSYGGTLDTLWSNVFWSGDTTFSNNTAAGLGGCSFLDKFYGADVGITPGPVHFEGNTAKISGGALYMSTVAVGPTFVMANFTANSAPQGGAVYSVSSGTAGSSTADTTYKECLFTDNRASATGGAIESVAGEDLIVNSTFAGNTAGVGGALRLAGSTELEGCTFIENVSHENEGAAISNLGVLDFGEDGNGTRFTGNVFWCEAGTFLDTEDATVNVTRYERVCNGCGECDGCEVENENSVPVCTAQMEHTRSEGGATTIETLKVDRGFWRATNSSRVILACYNENACVGGRAGPSSFCQLGYEGPYCSVCSEGYSMSLAFTCTKCVNSDGGVAIMVAVAILILCVVIALCKHLVSGERDVDHEGIIGRFTKHLPLQSIKIVLVVWQIVTQFSSVANVIYPSVYQRFLDSVNVLNFDVLWIPSAGCIVDADFHYRLLAPTIGPLIVLALLAATYTIAKRTSSGSEAALQKIRHKHVSMVLLISFLVYSSVSGTVFQTFACDSLDDDREYLRADYRIECTSSKHQAFESFAGIMIMVYPLGIPAFYAVLLYKSRGVLESKTDRETSLQAQTISDLWEPYKPERFYYELIECLRRILLTGVVVFIYPDTAAQVSVTLIIAFAFVVVSQSFSPFVSKWDTRISLTGHVVVFLSMYLALLSKVDVSGERDNSRKVFAWILVAAHACMVIAIVVEAIVMF
ncbi:unnamed protein product, partial [Pylaiella littoralis]